MNRTNIINTKGVTGVEYGLIGALISIVIMGAVTLTGVDTKEVFCVIGSTMTEAMGGEGSDCSNGSSQKTEPAQTPEEIIDSTNVGLAYIPKSLNLGGSGEPLHASQTTDAGMSTIIENILQIMTDINSNDPITGVWGFYDANKNPITTYSEYTDYMADPYSHKAASATIWSYNNSGWGEPYFEVTTESGKVYGIERTTTSNYNIYGIDIDTKQTVYSATNK